ncbi:MAG: hypothetical protein C4K58_03895 [Flavobacteriaceae bacterium]|nr:MAG: hypothetical protein C4K58_03895 [Flavobacteriaceae bacterium]
MNQTSNTDYGAFEWQKRMGIHEAYHTNSVNRIIHWLCIPFELFALVSLFSMIPLPFGLNLAFVMLVPLSIIYLATDLFLGAIMSFILAVLWILAYHFFPEFSIWNLLAVILIFFLTFKFQTGYGHGTHEEGRDDTEMNFAEFGKTKDPIPLILIFYYHLVEIAFNLGYKPEIRKKVEQVTLEEKQKMGII